MKRLGLAAVLLTVSATAGAQVTDCPAAVGGVSGQNAARDICLRSKDAFQLIAPQLGTAITGGNPVLGQGGTLGGIGHFTVEARVISVLNGDVPNVGDWSAPSTTAPASQQLATLPFPVPLPAVDGAIGVFKGLPLGLTNVGGIDLLLSAAYVPTIDKEQFKVTPKSNIKFGYGARLGLLQESLVVPGVSVTWMKRDLPTTTMTGSATLTGSSLSFTMADATIKTTSWRLIASKSLIIFGLAAGVGQDTYDQTATFSGSATTLLTGTSNFGPFALDNKMTRTNYFANASINLLLLKIVAEIGQVSGGDLTPTPFNTFSGGAADDSRAYGSIGLRFSF
jgi:hypothetical protein